MFEALSANTTIASLRVDTLLVADRSFGGWCEFEESLVLKEADLLDQLCYFIKDGSKAAYPIHQFINVLPIKSMVDQLYETVCLKATKQISTESPLLLSTAQNIN